jgi:tol-pal system protein YbgF
MRVLGFKNARVATVAGLLMAVAHSAIAQEFKPLPPVEQPAAQPAAQPAPPPAQKSALKAGQNSAVATGTGDAALRQRVEQLEEQIVDMQVVIGTLESLAKTSGSTASSPQAVRNANAPAGNDSARVSSLEAQVQALSQQVQQLQNGKTGAIGAGVLPPTPIVGVGAQSAVPQPSTTPVPGFGSTTVTTPDGSVSSVTPDSNDPIGGLIANAPIATAGPGGGVATQPLPPVAGTAPLNPAVAPAGAAAAGDAKQLYETAYSSLLNQNYIAAQTGFQEFLRRFPKESLAPDALFWLGESHYMQRNYTDAAEAFDLVASAYGASAKAPEAQLRRANTLVQLGRKDDACAALKSLNAKYPNARAVLKTKADAERQRAGCA